MKNFIIRLYDKNNKESSYKGYKPIEVPATHEFWKAKHGLFTNKKIIIFPTNIGKQCYITYISIEDNTGILWNEKVTKELICVTNMTPEMHSGQFIVKNLILKNHESTRT